MKNEILENLKIGKIKNGKAGKLSNRKNWKIRKIGLLENGIIAKKI